ncbi:MAG: Uma2 family endonuclease [Phormidesmis sp.]
MVQTPTKPLSLEVFLKLPETKPASEYIDGRIAQKPMPQGKHSKLRLELAALINAAARPQKVACTFLELRCTFGGSSIVPDLSVFKWARIPKEDSGEVANIFPLAPDWTIEILSQGQRPTRVTKNILRCLKHGTQMGWLIDPEDKSVFVYQPNQETEIFDEPGAALPMPPFMSELTLKVEDLFALLLL